MTADAGRSTESNDWPPQQYLGDMFALNPIWESHQILIQRRRTLKLPTVVGVDVEPVDYQEQQRRREQGLERLKKIQSHYFQMTADALQAGLGSLTADRHPELAATVSRLTAAAKHRESINAMLDDPECDRELAIAFGRSLTLAPADAGFAKEQYLRTLDNRRSHAKALKSIGRIEEIDPALIDLERDWFATIRNSRSPILSRKNAEIIFGIGAFITGMLVRFIMHAFELGS